MLMKPSRATRLNLMPAKPILPGEDQPSDLNQIVAMNEALILGAVRQHELAAAKEVLNAQLQAEISERKQAETALRASEQRFRALFELGPVAVYSCDAEGVIKEYNRRAAELWGRAPAEGTPVERFCGSVKLFRPDGAFLPHDECPMAEVLAGKIPEAIDREVLIERPDGSRVTVVVNIRPLKDDCGIISGAINCFYDITERKRAEQALAEKARLLDLSDDAIVVRDFSGSVTLWNKGAEKLYGWSSEEATGKKLDALLKIEFPKPMSEIVAELQRDGQLVGEVIQTTRNGRRVQALCRRVLDRGTASVLTSYTDITDRKQIEEELRQAHALLAEHAGQLESVVAERTEELVASNHQLEAFVYTIAHDLRAPLRSMKTFSNILLEDESGALSPKGQDYALRINKSARFMDALLNDLLAFSRISQQKVDLTPVDLGPIVQEVQARLQSELQENNGRIEINGAWPSVLAHSPTLNQVLYNLVSNGLKFARPNVSPLIRIWAEEVNAPLEPKPISTPAAREKETAQLNVHGELPPAKKESALPSRNVRIWVEDNGIGIAPQYQEQIFRVFIRLESNLYQGTGIGLAIVQTGIERMGGRVGVESTPGQGSRFWFELRKA